MKESEVIDALVAVREDMGKDQESFGKMIGYSKDQVSLIERRKSKLPYDYIYRVSKLSRYEVPEILRYLQRNEKEKRADEMLDSLTPREMIEQIRMYKQEASLAKFQLGTIKDGILKELEICEQELREKEIEIERLRRILDELNIDY